MRKLILNNLITNKLILNKQASNKLKPNQKFLCSIILIISYTIPFSALADDNQAWLSLTNKVWQSEDKKTKIVVYAEGRTKNGVDTINGLFIGPIIRHQLNPYINVGWGYKFLKLKNSDDKYVNKQRLEVEVTPSYSFGDLDQYKVDLRNRVEIITRSGEQNTIRLRHRLTFNKKLSGDGLVKDLYASNELIYKVINGQPELNQIRFIPLGTKLKIAGKSFKLFYMYKRNYTDPRTINHAFGLSFSF